MAVLSTAPLQFVASIPPATRAFTAATIVCSLLYYVLTWTNDDDFSAPYLVLIPGSSIFYPWTFLTSALVETTIFELLFTLLVIPASLRYLERLWGTVETIKFIAVTITVSNIIAFGLNWLEFLVLRYPVFLYGQQYHGQMALQIGVLVGFTQLIPEHQVQLFGVLKARVKASATLPMSYVTFSTVMCIIGFQCPYIVIQFGWLVSYLWLRFYKKNIGEIGGPTYGDKSETFAFVSWFPPFIHYPITLLANTAHTLATKFHLIPSSGSDLESGGYSQLPGGARAEAERRRAMALKALDQRLANGAASPTPPRSANGAGPPSRPPPVANADTATSKKPASESDVTDVEESSRKQDEDSR
ncbi:eukaryotic integral membrane protein [Amylocystis lapponica]|nr:eukaryotic integral membrane protein [Amylocystis lapponica]